MLFRPHPRSRRASQRGVYLIVTALSLAVLVSFAGLAINTSLDYAAQRDAQSSGDASALAGAQSLTGTAISTLAIPNEPIFPLAGTTCIQQVTLALSTAALNGMPVRAASSACDEGNSSHTYCDGTYRSNGTVNTPGNTGPTSSQYDVIFYDTPGHGPAAGCSSSSFAKTAIEVISPPPPTATDLGVTGGSQVCDSGLTQYACVEVVVLRHQSNIALGTLSNAPTLITTRSVAYGAFALVGGQAAMR